MSLAELQQQFAHAVITGEALPALLAGRVPPEAALSVHRDTIMGALTNALRLSHPTVDALVGERFFDRTARIFAEANLPMAASLSGYGDCFAAFLAGFPPAAALPYLPDVARLDRVIETALRAPVTARRFVLDAAVSMALPQSLTVLRLDYPAADIRAALGDDQALAAIVTAPEEHFVLVWRKDSEAAVRRVSPATGKFLAALLAGEGAEVAFQAAMRDPGEAQALQALRAELFAASFCTVIATSEELSP